MNVFYSGCVVVEVRDYRRSATGSHDTQYVLLRPSAQVGLINRGRLLNGIFKVDSLLTIYLIKFPQAKCFHLDNLMVMISGSFGFKEKE